MSDLTTIDIVVPPGLHVHIDCAGCRHQQNGHCGLPDEDEECVISLSGTTVSAPPPEDEYHMFICTADMRRQMGQCVAVGNIVWCQDEEIMDEDTPEADEDTWYCPVEQITSGWSRIEYTVEGNELRMSDAR